MRFGAQPDNLHVFMPSHAILCHYAMMPSQWHH